MSKGIYNRKPMTQETKDKISKGHLNKPLSEEHKESIRKTLTGRKDSLETKEKKSKCKMKEKNGFYGKKHTQETKNKISKSKLGYKMSEETKKSYLGNTNAKGSIRTEETKIKTIKTFLKNMKKNKFQSSWERKFRDQILIPLDIKFIEQFRFKDFHHPFDFYLSDLNILIEIDGDYFHSLPEHVKKDELINKYVINNTNNILFRFNKKSLEYIGCEIKK